jgi:periplasmic protein TonB
MTTHVQQASILSGRSMTLVAVIALHALLITALIAVKIVPPLMNSGPAPFEMVVVPPEVIPPPPQLMPAEPQKVMVTVPPIELPVFNVPDDTLVAQAIAPPNTADSGPVQIDAGPAEGSVMTAPPARVFTDMTYRAVKAPNEFYPPTSVTLQEQGIAIVRVCVDGAGRLDGIPTIQTSSGHKRLDQAAIRWTREALQFTPATENAVGVRSCKGFRVTFNLNEDLR